MSPNIIRRFIIILVAGSTAAFLIALATDYFDTPPGDYEVRQGDIHLSSGEYDEALADFDRALEEQPDHRGALMGRALVFLQTGRDAEAEAELTYLIDTLEGTLAEDDTTGQGALAAAYANRGIVRDRQGSHERALADYVKALQVDEGAVEGPNLGHRILHDARPSTVRDRARYLYEQFQLPEAERVLTMPDRDAQQRMHKP
jgi:tetratricopeptide (TPR) repeat protein